MNIKVKKIRNWTFDGKKRDNWNAMRTYSKKIPKLKRKSQSKTNQNNKTNDEVSARCLFSISIGEIEKEILREKAKSSRTQTSPKKRTTLGTPKRHSERNNKVKLNRTYSNSYYLQHSEKSENKSEKKIRAKSVSKTHRNTTEKLANKILDEKEDDSKTRKALAEPRFVTRRNLVEKNNENKNNLLRQLFENRKNYTPISFNSMSLNTSVIKSNEIFLKGQTFRSNRNPVKLQKRDSKVLLSNQPVKVKPIYNFKELEKATAATTQTAKYSKPRDIASELINKKNEMLSKILAKGKVEIKL